MSSATRIITPGASARTRRSPIAAAITATNASPDRFSLDRCATEARASVQGSLLQEMHQIGLRVSDPLLQRCRRMRTIDESCRRWHVTCATHRISYRHRYAAAPGS